MLEVILAGTAAHHHVVNFVLLIQTHEFNNLVNGLPIKKATVLATRDNSLQVIFVFLPLVLLVIFVFSSAINF